MEALNKIQSLQKELNEALIEREAEVEASLAALLAGAHVLLLGPPGTAKSMLANMICNSIDKAEFFSWLLTKFTPPEELFGPVSMKGIKEDSYRRITKGKLPQAHIAFLDEIFKANSAILNSLLTLINEREFHNDGEKAEVPLLSCIGASNELPQGEELGALYDRFLIRFWVDYIESDTSFCDLLEDKVGGAPTTKLTLEEIAELQKACSEVEITREFVETLREIMHELKRKGVTASDRRWKAVVKVLKAYAFLRGEKEVTDDELETLADMLWEKPQDRKIIMETVAPRANPLNLKALEYMDAAQETYNTWKNNPDDDQVALQANAVLKEILKKIPEDCKDRPANKTKKLKKVEEKIKSFRKEIVTALDI